MAGDRGLPEIAGWLALAGAAALAAAPPPASAGDILPFADARLRHERLDEAGFARDAEALTLRARAGIEASLAERLSLLAELEAVSVLQSDYVAGPAAGGPRPRIPDAAVVDLNRLQLIYESDGLFASAGRQVIRHDDERFVGLSDWRQDDRTFDAARIDHDLAPGLTASYAYVWRVNQTLGTRADAQSDSHLAHLEWVRSGALKASAFAYLIDLERGAGTATFGARLTGDLPAGPAVLTYDAAYARQVDHNAASEFALDHLGLDATLSYGPLAAWAGIERWEGDGARGFDLPFAARHRFRGWSDAFALIPADGVEDLFVGARADWPSPPIGERLSLEAAYHEFAPTRGGGDFGGEWNLGLGLDLTRAWSASLQLADYDGGSGGPAARETLYIGLEWRY